MDDPGRVAALTATQVITLPSGARCSLHGRDPKSRLVNELMAKGYSSKRIQAEARLGGFRVSLVALSRHRRLCFEDTNGAQAEARVEDLAVLVRDQVRRGVLNGSIALKARDGMQAQQLIDRREEKKADRTFMLNLAQLLSGAGKRAPATIVESTAIDVTPEESPLLAPPELREP